MHPGGPYWAKKDLGAWSIPKGEYSEGDDPLDAALREFQEELGFAPHGDLVPLTPIRQKSGKTVTAWALEGDCDPVTIRSNTFTIEWPPKSGKTQEFPEVDRAEWFPPWEARRKLLSSQTGFIDELLDTVADRLTHIDKPGNDDGREAEQRTLFD